MSKIFVVALVLIVYVNQSLQISPKLDFTESREIINQNKSPKIQGVRVIVDSKLRQSAESKSDEKDIPLDGRKKVGIRTDITFELDDEKNVSNSTSNEKEIGKDDDDASVPIFKGTSDSKENNDRNNIYHDNRRIDTLNQNHNRPNGPIFHRTDDENTRNINDWSNSIPLTGVWTTEINPWRQINSHNRNQQQHHGVSGFKSYTPYTIGNGWKPCDCNTPTFRQSNNQQQNYKFFADRFQPRNPGIDDKLEAPFKNRN